MGRPDISARVHLLQLPVYIAALYYLIVAYGALGAAIAWSARQLINSAALQYFARKQLRGTSPAGLLPWGIQLSCGLVLVWSTGLIESLPLRFGYVLILLLVYAFAGWQRLLSSDDREFVRRLLKNLSGQDRAL